MNLPRTRRVVGSLAGSLVGSLVAGLMFVPAVVLTSLTVQPAAAATNDQAISGTPSSMWQTNNNVEAIEVSGGVVYAGGTFTSVRPPGAAAGTNEVPRTYLAAFNASTGALVTGFNVRLDGRVEDISIAPGGRRMYVVGRFTSVNGVARNRVAAINIPSGTLDTSFIANANTGVVAVDSTASSVYVTGDFSTIRGTAKARFAALDPTTGALQPGFVADLDSRGYTVDVTPDGSRVLVGGNFTTVNGTVTGGMASVHPTTGALQRWDANITQPINTNCAAKVTDIISLGENAYVTAEGDPPGCYEGTYSARISDGRLNWNSTCLGASLGLAILHGVLYKASHQHDCAFNPGDARGGYVGGTSRDSFIWWRLVGQNLADGSFVHWSPNTNASTGSNPVGPHVIATDGRQLFVGGDFTRVDNTQQQGIARFEPGNGAAPNRPDAPTVQATRVGGLTVQWPATYDRDSGTLTYRLYRGSTLIHQAVAESYPWSRPMMRFDDTGLTPGVSYRYRLQVSDGARTSSSSSFTSGTVRSTAPPAYADLVRRLGANLYWRVGDSGATLADSSAAGGAPGEKVGGVTTAPGAVAGDGAVVLDGVTGHLTSRDPQNLTPTFTQSAWFRTTSQTGGSLLAVTDAKTGVGRLSDRAVTMDNNGNVVFSVHQPPRTGSPDPLGPRLNNVRQEGLTFNDGSWHQVVATWSGTTAALYVDGRLLGTYEGLAGGLTSGYQRVGYTDLRNEQAVFGRNFYNQKWPLTEHFRGSIDEVATFPTALTADQVADLWAAGVGGGAAVQPQPVPPTASFTQTASGLTVDFDGRASSDTDGRVESWAWDFGHDGATGTGATVTHIFPAAGTYPVTLRVTDDDGLSAQRTAQITVTAPSGQPSTSTVVARESTWRWRYAAGAPSAGWNAVGFDASSWAQGPAVLGFGSTVPLATDVDTFATVEERPIAAYFSRTFQVANASAVTDLVLETVADDGVAVYVNGTEVGRSNLPPGDLTSRTYASTAQNTTTARAAPVRIVVPARLLRSGTNVIAAETHLKYRGTRDMSFDLEARLTTVAP